jgi:hypothetical protein
VSDLNQLDRTLTQILEETWEILWKDAFLYLLAGLLCTVLVGISLGVLGGVALVGFALLIERRRQGHDVGPAVVFSGFEFFVPATLALVVMLVGVSLGLVLLVLPGLFLLAAWSLTFCAMARERLTAGEALARSYGIFRDHALIVVVLLIVLGLVNSIAGVLIFAQLISIPYSLIALSVAYDKLSATSPVKDASRHADGMSPHRVEP